MQSKFQKFIICGIVILIHLLLFFWITSSPSTANEPEDVPQAPVVAPAVNPTVNAPAAPQTNQAGKNGTKPPVVTPTPSQPAPVNYNTGNFSKAILNMPVSTQKLADGATAIVVIDQDKRQIIWEKGAESSRSIASISKLMTALLLMEDVTAGRANLNDVVKVTADDKSIMKRWGHGCFIAPGQSYTLQELLKAMMISSANDCAYLAGRHLAGTNEKFVERMNQRAQELGLKSMKFTSVNGHPNVGGSQRMENYGSAMDVAILADMVCQYPEIMKWAGTKQDRLRETAKDPFDLNATNHLLRDKVPGITGLKTGFTDAAGYCLVATCERMGRHMMVVILGVSKDAGSKQRDYLARKLLDWAYGN